jgi:heme exporter protein CcmB
MFYLLFIFKEIKYIFYNFISFIIFILLFIIFILLFIFNIGPNYKIISHLGLIIINFNLFIISILASSYLFLLYKSNGILQLFSLSLFKFEFLILIKCFLFWVMFQIPLCLFTYVNYLLFNLSLSNYYIIFISYLIFTLIISFTNLIATFLVFHYQFSSLFIFIFNFIFNIPIIIYITSITDIMSFDYSLSFLFFYLFFIMLICIYLSSLLFFYLFK